MARKVNLSTAAREAGVSRSAASDARRKGRLVTDADGLVDANEAAAVLGKRRRGRPLGPVPTQAGETLAAAQLRKESALADLRQMVAARMRGELLPAEDVRRADEAIWAAVRDRLRSIPMSLAPLLVEAAHKPNADQGVYALMLSSIDEALTEIASAEIVAVDKNGNELE